MLYRRKILLIILIVCPMFIFSSCGEDIVTPIENQFDPPRYSWTVDTIYANIADIWAADSNNVFFVAHLNDLIYYNGQTYQSFNYGANNGMSYVDGINKNNV